MNKNEIAASLRKGFRELEVAIKKFQARCEKLKTFALDLEAEIAGLAAQRQTEPPLIKVVRHVGNKFLPFCSGCSVLLAAGALALFTMSAEADFVETNKAVISFEQIRAVVGEQHSSNNSSAVVSDPAGACLHCPFQQLDGWATSKGLWLASTAEGAEGKPFRVIASKLGRTSDVTFADAGIVEVTGQSARFFRSGLTEEYTVGMDGVRQDFVIERRPQGAGLVRLELKVTGAKVSAMSDGAQLVLDDSRRRLAYNRLKTFDARGRELKSIVKAASDSCLEVVIEDFGAVYPVRIDPTFSDANWVSFGGMPGVDGSVYAAAIDSAGNLYIGGTFLVAGNTIANGIAKWDGNSWSALGSGVNGSVNALAISGSNLFVGGSFTTAGGIPASNIARWDGNSWSVLASGINGPIKALTISGNNLFAGGSFTAAGEVSATNIAQWDGSSWSALGAGLNGSIAALTSSGTNLYAGGGFTTAGGMPANCVAQWNGSSWSALGTGISGSVNTYGNLQGPVVHSLTVLGTNLIVAGQFTSAGGVSASSIAKWDGNSWSNLGLGLSGDYLDVTALAIFGTNLFAGGYFASAGGVAATNVAEWNGSSWSSLTSGTFGSVYALAESGTNLYAGGNFGRADGVTVSSVAQWNGSSWAALGSGTAQFGNLPFISALAVSGPALYAGGNFNIIGGVLANNIAQWNGGSWSALGSGTSGVGVNPMAFGQWGFVYSLAVLGTNIYAGGYFTNAGGVLVGNVAQWNGNSWSAMGSGMNDRVYALAAWGTNLYAGGQFTIVDGVYNNPDPFQPVGGVTANHIAEWDGSSWSALGAGVSFKRTIYGDDALVFAMAVSGTNLYVGGTFTNAGGMAANSIAKWDGTSWSALGSGVNSYVYALAASGTNLYAGGTFTSADGVTANYIAKWDGTSWSALGSGLNGYVNALAASGTNLYVGGTFTSAGGIAVTNLACWDGSSWSPLAPGINGEVDALAVADDKNLYVAGRFTVTGNKVSAFLAEALVSQSSYNLAIISLGSGTNILTALGTPNYAYALDFTTNLAPPVNWMPQATSTPPGLSLTFTNVSITPQGFYRTRNVP